MKRIPSLDGLRAISILLVIVGHWTSRSFHSAVALTYAALGVRIFFVISGYLITSILLQEHEQTGGISLRKFYVRRAYRIFPAAMVFMVIVFTVYWNQLRWYDITAAILYLANFDALRPWFLGHLWSLSVEEQFYFIWPGVLRKWYSYRKQILLAVAASAPIYSAWAFFFRFPEVEHTFPSVMDNLAAGCLLAVLAPKIPKIKAGIFALMVLTIALVPLRTGDTRVHTLVLLFILWPLLYASIAGVILHTVRNPYPVLNFPVIQWLGRISYSVYLWQQLFSFSPNPRPWYFLFAPIATGCLSYYLIEQPMLRLRDRKKSAALRSFPENQPIYAAQAGD